MKPASRITDFHSCPVPSHIGGPVTSPGDPTVLIGSLAAARFSDMTPCTGAVDVVSMGAPTVVIGKLLACRQGEATEHKGTVLFGFPTVLVGGPPPGVSVVRRGKVLIVVNRDAKTIMIVGVQEFKGDGATDDYVRRATDCINSTWSGETTFEGQSYTVDAMVSGRKTGDPANPLANQIRVKQTSESVAVTSRRDPANQSPYGNGDGYQHSNEMDDGDVAVAHEFGHAVGLRDEYIEGPKDAKGNRTVTQTGPDGGIMGYTEPGSRPTPDNFESLITGKGLL